MALILAFLFKLNADTVFPFLRELYVACLYGSYLNIVSVPINDRVLITLGFAKIDITANVNRVYVSFTYQKTWERLHRNLEHLQYICRFKLHDD